MVYAKLIYSKGKINKAGQILASPSPAATRDFIWAVEVLTNFRASHLYPINTFQALLRKKLSTIDSGALVAQRLKRTPSIVSKLQRFQDMNLARMQDIGGLRAVVGSMPKLEKLVRNYRDATFAHRLVSYKDYIREPKDDGYRSVHLVFKYSNARAPEYEGLLVELQIRTKLQHAWATAVETMGTFLGQALKSGKGEKKWREFFLLASAAIALYEKSPLPPGYEGAGKDEIISQLAAMESRLKVLDKLRGFAIATKDITSEGGTGAYHLVVLDSHARTVAIRSFAQARLEEANSAYTEIEKRASQGEKLEAVLVAAGTVSGLRKAYPNYFLDTHAFVQAIEDLTAVEQESGEG